MSNELRAFFPFEVGLSWATNICDVNLGPRAWRREISWSPAPLPKQGTRSRPSRSEYTSQSRTRTGTANKALVLFYDTLVNSPPWTQATGRPSRRTSSSSLCTQSCAQGCCSTWIEQSTMEPIQGLWSTKWALGQGITQDMGSKERD